MKLVIAFTVSMLRPEYLRRALDAWYEVRGVQDCTLLCCCEPPRDLAEADDLQDGIASAFGNTVVTVNAMRLGCAANTREAMRQAFGLGAEFAVLAEEDLLPATDVVEFFRWAAAEYRQQRDVTTVSAHSFSGVPGARLGGAVVRRPWFNPQLWGTWPDRWEDFIDPRWRGLADNPESWDANLRNEIHLSRRDTVFPVRSRAQHIGAVSTLQRPDLAEFFYKSTISDSFDRELGPQDYYEIDDDAAWKLIV